MQVASNGWSARLYWQWILYNSVAFIVVLTASAVLAWIGTDVLHLELANKSKLAALLVATLGAVLFGGVLGALQWRAAGGLRVGELQELLIAGGVGPGRGLGEDPTDRAEGGSRQGVTVGVDADDAVDGVCQDGHAVAPSGGGRGRCRPGRSHRAAQL